MSHNQFRVGTIPPPPPPAIPGYSPLPPGPPTDHRRWSVLATAVMVGAVLASAAAATITLQARHSTTAAAPSVPTPITVTVSAPEPPPVTPLPTAQADRQTCQQGFIATQAPTRSATEALSILPAGVTILDPAVQGNPEWAAAVRKAGEFYQQASDVLEAEIAPGATPVLAEAANTAVKAFHVLGDSYIRLDPISGNAHDIALEASDQMAVLCTRLAP